MRVPTTTGTVTKVTTAPPPKAETAAVPQPAVRERRETTWEVVKGLPRRFVQLLSKLLGVKGLLLVISVALYLQVERFSTYALLVVFGIVIFGRELPKMLALLRK